MYGSGVGTTGAPGAGAPVKIIVGSVVYGPAKLYYEVEHRDEREQVQNNSSTYIYGKASCI